MGFNWVELKFFGRENPQSELGIAQKPTVAKDTHTQGFDRMEHTHKNNVNKTHKHKQGSGGFRTKPQPQCAIGQGWGYA